MADTHITTLSNGHEIAWVEWGAAASGPVFAFHGTPGSGTEMVLGWSSPPARMLCPDRPGYGRSPSQPRRVLSDWADDVARLADHLGVGSFSVLGVSGGASHALACAVFLRDRVKSTAVVSGAVPLPATEEPDSRWSPRAKIRSIRPRANAELQVFVSRRRPKRVLKIMSKQGSATDARTLERNEVRDVFTCDARSASRTTGRSIAQDLRIDASIWGLELASISTPVHIWHGSEDRTDPIDRARLLAGAIPTSIFHELSGEGRLIIFDHLVEIVEALDLT